MVAEWDMFIMYVNNMGQQAINSNTTQTVLGKIKETVGWEHANYYLPLDYLHARWYELDLVTRILLQMVFWVAFSVLLWNLTMWIIRHTIFILLQFVHRFLCRLLCCCRSHRKQKRQRPPSQVLDDADDLDHIIKDLVPNSKTMRRRRFILLEDVDP